MVCHSLLQWTTFCQISPPWPVHLGWPHTAWLSFIELDKAVIPMQGTTGSISGWGTKIPQGAQCTSKKKKKRNNFNKLRLLHLPICRKALNLLTWDVWVVVVLLIAVILRCSDYLSILGFFPQKTLIFSWLLPYLFETVLPSYLRGCLSGLSQPNKTYSQLSDCTFFFQSTVGI